MAPARKDVVMFPVYKCARCPNGRTFDMLSIPVLGRNFRRCLQDHVTRLHPGHEGDCKDLIGEKIMKEKRLGNAHRRSTADNTPSQYGTASLLPSRTMRQRLHPMPPSPPRSALNHMSRDCCRGKELDSQTPNPKQNDMIGNVDPEGDNVESNYSFNSSAQDARNEVAKILEGLNSDISVIIGIDEWDQSALAGRLDQKMAKLVKLALSLTCSMVSSQCAQFQMKPS